MTEPVDRAKLIYFLTEYFSDEEIIMLCLVEFPAVYNDFGSGQRKSQKIADLVAYCYRQGEVERLLAVLQRERPLPYPTHFGPATPRPATPPPAPKVRNPRQVFISHAHQDAELAQRLAADLRARGWPVWMAPDSIQTGEQWVEAVNRGLEESGVLLLLISHAAVNSAWVRRETNVAIELEHQGEIQFYPLEVQPCDLPPLWRGYQRTPFGGRYEAALDKLLARLDGRALPSPAASLLPPEPKLELTQTSDFSKKSDVFVVQFAIHPITGKEMVRIRAGEFLYGENKETHYLDEYWIDKTPVTNAEYARFVATTGHKTPEHWQGNTPPHELADHPVVYVSWHDAEAYAKWAGCQLPTEEQWEKAARGTDGRSYPWGNTRLLSYSNILDNHINETTPVRMFSPGGDSPYGCVDMSGNVWEWTVTKTGGGRVIRGGSWSTFQLEARVFERSDYYMSFKSGDYGFRVVAVSFPGS
ncbi:MAG: SUMF1/EgtB/PvdO family nonheme iron enzyme [Anaerolineae bacterium]|nr:SUMF1/EgtB/PvdO family nonheme iron enzyme [Anaerolineae bacterium]